MHTHQETFDVVARGILAQGGPGMEDGKVVYLATNGRRCGAGQAMDLDLFRPEVNHNTVFMAAMVVPGLFGDHSQGILRSLQKIHDDVALQRKDDAKFLARWTTAMRGYAANHEGRTVRCEGPDDDPDHFDHDRHTRALEEAVHVLRASGRRDADALAGAVSRAAALHRDMQGRVAHAAHAMRQLDLARRHLVPTPTTTACLPLALDRVRRARDLLDQYVAKREAPWIEPAPVLFPFVDALVAGRSGLDEDEEIER